VLVFYDIGLHSETRSNRSSHFSVTGYGIGVCEGVMTVLFIKQVGVEQMRRPEPINGFGIKGRQGGAPNGVEEQSLVQGR